MKFIFPLLALLGGAAVAVQGQINGGLGKKVGVLESSFISFSIGTLALFFVVLFFGQGQFMAVSTVPRWQLIGGLFGAFYVVTIILVVPKIGVAGAFAAAVAGQIIIGAVIDHFGLFGGARIPFDFKKASAIALLFISLILFNHK